MNTKNILLRAEKISVSYGGVRALLDVSMYIREGEMVAIMGPNGAGKSTILKAMFGLTETKSGAYFLNGKHITPVPHELSALGISFVPQGRRVFGTMTVEENLEMGGIATCNRSMLEYRKSEVYKIFPTLRSKCHSWGASLSGGEQQMLAIARGLISEPKLLLLDEPTLGLSPKFVKEIFLKIKEINTKRQTALVIVEHNIKTILGLVNRGYVLDHGKVIENGSPKELISSEVLERVFLGR